LLPIVFISNCSIDPLGSGITPGLDSNSFNWFAQQNGGGFDPVLFGDYREPQDAVASQDFGAFFNDAFPLPELGSPQHNFDEPAPSPARPDIMARVQAAQDGEDALIAADDASKLVPCNKIWFVDSFPRTQSNADTMCRDRIQSMEKFRNGEVDIDNLCSALRSKARCSEGGPAVREEHVNNILGSGQ
jgi:AP-1-like transcription factor